MPSEGVNGVKRHHLICYNHNVLFLRIIYPMVVYHASEPYPYSVDILDLVEAPRLLSERYFLKPFQLIDLGEVKDEEIKSHAWAGVMEFALKHAIERDVLSKVKEIVGLMRHIINQGGENYVEIVLEYLLERGEMQSQNEFIELINKEISTEIGEKVMTLAERIRTEGRQQGMEDIAKRLLAEKLDIAFIAKVTHLSIAQIKQLAEILH